MKNRNWGIIKNVENGIVMDLYFEKGKSTTAVYSAFDALAVDRLLRHLEPPELVESYSESGLSVQSALGGTEGFPGDLPDEKDKEA